MAINNNTNRTSEPDKNSKLPDISLAGTTTTNKQRSSSQSPSIISTVNNHCHSRVSVTLPYIDTRNAIKDNTSTSTIQVKKISFHINRRSSFRIATKNSLYFYHQWMKIPKYQDLILVKDHVTAKWSTVHKINKNEK